MSTILKKKPLSHGSYLVRASESLDAVSAETKLSLPVRDFNTVSGWILDMMGRIPRPGEVVQWGGVRIEIIDATKKTVNRIKLCLEANTDTCKMTSGPRVQ